jgi:DNA-binding transcriptional LysR family regulator
MMKLLRRLQFRDLELLVRLEKTRSLRRTAEELGFSQPAATKALRKIEGLFGSPLFERTTRRVLPTAAGLLAIDHARLLLGNLDLMDRHLATRKSGLPDERRIGVIPYAAPALMPHLVKELMKTHPGVKLLVIESTTEVLIEQLRRGALDIVMARYTATADDIIQRSIYREQGVVVVRPGHALGAARKVKPNRLASFSWILPPAGSPTRLAIDVALLRADLAPPKHAIETISVSFLTHLLNGTDMVGILPRSVASVQQGYGILKIVPVAIAIDLPDLCLYRRQSAIADEVVDSIVEQAFISGKALLSQYRA